ncbi:sensor histidine kinase [Methylocystis heyeri]|nr:HAMP domain-containing sensor histidine kinase [Methylocystis heyeri]
MPNFRLKESAIFRRTLAIAALFIATNLCLFGFIYWQTAVFETRRIMGFMERQAPVLAETPSEQIRQSMERRHYDDVHRFTVSGLFEQNGAYLAGGLKRLPPGLIPDGGARRLDAFEFADGSNSSEPAIFVARSLPDGRILVVGRNIQELANLLGAVSEALKLGVIPMAILAVGAGAFLSLRMNSRLTRAQRVLRDFQKGDLRRRLELTGARDDFDRLAEAVNVLLDDLERAINELHHVGNNIAHDLRTPLSRVRGNLERLQQMLAGQQTPLALLERAVAGLDQTFALTTALLRIAQLETGRARAFFATVDLGAILRDAAELYEPLAEAKSISLDVETGEEAPVEGDKDLLLEAFANLVDNAIKFAPEGGRIRIALEKSPLGPVAVVADDGPGISEAQRTEVFKRFYRGAQSRHIVGNGLGLALVAAIVKLHGFRVEIADAEPGCIFRLRCYPQTSA